MKDVTSHIINRLASMARLAPEAPLPTELPLGMATRVLASIRGGGRRSVWEFLSLRALPVAAAIAVLCLWIGVSVDPDQDEDDLAEAFVSEVAFLEEGDVEFDSETM